MHINTQTKDNIKIRKIVTNRKRNMNYSKNSITNLLILSIFLATLILLIYWTKPPPYKSFPDSNSEILKDELEIALENAAIMPDKNLIVTIINKAYVQPHGDDYPSMFDIFLEGFWEGEGTRNMLDHVLVVAMDKTAHERCAFRRLNCYRMPAADGGDSEDFAGEKVYMSADFIEMMWRRTLFLLKVLEKGYNFIFTDTDVLWLRNPFTRLSMNETLDLQISTDSFNGNSSSQLNNINTGLYYIRSNNRTISLLHTWYDMRKNSTGLKEQDVLQELVHNGVLNKIELKTRFLDTLYFSGFCSDSTDPNVVTTVHANCCRTIGAKMVDLKAVLRDWKRFKNNENNNSSINFRWNDHISCTNSWL